MNDDTLDADHENSAQKSESQSGMDFLRSLPKEIQTREGKSSATYPRRRLNPEKVKKWGVIILSLGVIWMCYLGWVYLRVRPAIVDCTQWRSDLPAFGDMKAFDARGLGGRKNAMIAKYRHLKKDRVLVFGCMLFAFDKDPWGVAWEHAIWAEDGKTFKVWYPGIIQVTTLLLSGAGLVFWARGHALSRTPLPEAEKSIEQLVTQMKNSKEYTRWRAIDELRKRGPEACDAVDSLAVALKDYFPSLRKAAATALAAIGPQASRALPTLHSASEDSDGDVRQSVQEAIRRITSDERTHQAEESK